MPYLSHPSDERISFTWEGRTLETRPGLSVAAALYEANFLVLNRSRKFRRSRGLSGSFQGGHLVTIDGRPHCRSDKIPVQKGMAVSAENVWPSLGFDVLRLGALMPRRWARAGFEHPRWMPDGSFLWPYWERALWFAAGMVNPPAQVSPTILGRRIMADAVIIGGGPAGRQAAIDAANAGKKSIVLFSEGASPGQLSKTAGATLPDLPPTVQVFAGHKVFALYRGGRVVAAAPLDPSLPAVLVDAGSVVLATGRYSSPPLVDGADLPGVLEARAALKLTAIEGVSPGNRVVVIGTNTPTTGRDVVARTLSSLGVQVIDIIDVSCVRKIVGRHRVEGIEAGKSISCDAVVHAGPWRSDPVLSSQAGWQGNLRLMPGDIPKHIKIVGDASLASEPIAVPEMVDGRALVCPCMDVTVDEIIGLVAGGETHIEVLKRRTACGMGTCQGVPCWDNLAALVSRLTGESTESIGHPTYRPPRAGLTLAQAAGLDDFVAWDKGE